jgi:hypothetical protein
MKEIIKISLSEIEIKDLNDNLLRIEDISKVLGNLIFVNAESIETSDLARELHRGNEVEITEDELKDITVILAKNPYFKPWVHQQVMTYFTDKITFENKEGAE